ncbi:acyltransferase family protein [Lacticaseibacillus daqingensis]|uniref:acyltransferase family protein n=1 Tax=Lacticaseibacillus daqingensis TaxID=2486014 RepID=UPI000F7B3302|nr:acyltransferase family protein [Lacticaseibacillus daqingensis]
MGNTVKHTHQRIKWFSLVRITGLVLVLTYHFFQTSFTGGFIGVDVFFTFSGFLITSLMVDEFVRADHFALLAFYKRRFYRIVPPLVLAVLLVVPFTFLVGPDFITGLGKQIAAALGFVTNYFEINTGGSYETHFIPHLFVHTWSLAVEMHFYLIWGVLVFGLSQCVRHFGGRRSAQAASFRSSIALFALILSIASYLTLVIRANGLHEFSPVYFATVTHSFPFFIGAFLATLTGINTQPAAFTRFSARWTASTAALVMGISALGLLGLGLTLKFDQLITYRFGMLAAVLLACLMILAARILHDHTKTLREPKVVSFLADTSYSLYLYHWPLYVVFAHTMPHTLAVIATVGLGLLFSALSYYLIEPTLAGRKGHLFARLVTWPQIAPAVLTLAAVLSLTTVWRVHAAPTMSHLEQTLWIGSLYQDQDQLYDADRAVMAVHQPKPKAVTQTTAPTVTDYRAYAHKSTAAKHHIPAGVSIIGDSVTLGTRRYLGPHVADSSIDAAGERTMNLAYDVMMAQQKANTLREFVVICIGTNALDDYAEQLNKVLNDLAPGHKLVLMTPYNGQAGPTWNSTKLGELERTLPASYKWLTIADWGKIAPQHPHVFQGTDGVHFGGHDDGDVLYAQVINQALIEAAKKPAKK